MTNMTTLCYIEQGQEYLMLHRVSKDKDINKDKWIGVGGSYLGIQEGFKEIKSLGRRFDFFQAVGGG